MFDVNKNVTENDCQYENSTRFINSTNQDKTPYQYVNQSNKNLSSQKKIHFPMIPVLIQLDCAYKNPANLCYKS